MTGTRMMALLALGGGHPERRTDAGRARPDGKPTRLRRLALAIHDLDPAGRLGSAARKVAYRLRAAWSGA